MTYKMKTRALAALLTALLLMTLPGTVSRTSAETTPAPAETVIRVKNADELVAAIGSNVTVELLPGDYDLAAAASYGKDTANPYCRWEVSSEQGYELSISDVEGLTLRGAGKDETTLLIQDRYASVLTFSNCKNLTVASLTAGHNPAPGYCSGGVLHLVNCAGATVEGCGLFGCGTIGVWAMNSSDVTVTASRIYECSDSAVFADSCRNVQMLDCEIDHNGWKHEYLASCLFQAYGGDGFTVSNCQIHDNRAELLLQCSYTRSAAFVSNRVEYNTLSKAFAFNQMPAVVDGCAFHSNILDSWYGDEYGETVLYAQDGTGRELLAEDLTAMEIRPVELENAPAVPLREPTEVPVGGEITVTSVDEFLAAIGPDRTIVLDGESFCLADAADYGSVGAMYYHWEECYDGPQLVIDGVSNLTIRAAAGKEAATTLTATPRYANVIGFSFCENVTLSGLVLGHTEGSSECSGDVLDFENCNEITLDNCRLYGCGTMGVNAWYCIGLRLTDCEIYDCSIGGVVLGSVNGATFRNCRIHDVPSPAMSLYGCTGVLWNGKVVDGEHYDVTDTGELVPTFIG